MRFWIVPYAIGAVQAAMLAPALWRRQANAQANRVLAAWLAVIALDLGIKALHMAQPAAGYADAYRIARLLPFAYAPMFYLYVRTLVSGRAPGWRDALHGSGFALMLAWAGGCWLSGDPLSASGDWGRRWFDPVLFSIAVAYLGAAAVQIQRYRGWLRARRSDADRLSLRWLGTMAACQGVIWGIAAVHALAELPGVDYFLIYGAIAAWVCIVGWFSLGQPPVAEPLPAVAGSVEKDTPEATPAPVEDDDPRWEEVQSRLALLMSQQQAYREPALGIAQLARRSGYPEYLVSSVINRRLGGNFWDYVNRHRIEAACAHLADPAETRSILEIAYEVGFTSKSTFNAAFKRIAGETPTAWRSRHASPR